MSRTPQIVALTAVVVLAVATTAAASHRFSDVGTNSPHHDAIAWASGSGVLEGFADGRFGPREPVSRDQAASMLHRYHTVFPPGEGPQGPQGHEGPEGPRGPEGPPGADGDDGATSGHADETAVFLVGLDVPGWFVPLAHYDLDGNYIATFTSMWEINRMSSPDDPRVECELRADGDPIDFWWADIPADGDLQPGTVAMTGAAHDVQVLEVACRATGGTKVAFHEPRFTAVQVDAVH